MLSPASVAMGNTNTLKQNLHDSALLDSDSQLLEPMQPTQIQNCTTRCPLSQSDADKRQIVDRP
jgi:hypothetical protein